jgi:PEP-CTERM motif
MKKFFVLMTVVIFAVGMVTAAQATETIYTGQDLNVGGAEIRIAHPNSTAASNAFLAGLVGVGTETFESFSPGQGSPLNLVFPGAGTATLTDYSGSIANVPSGTNGFGRYPISGNQYWESSGNMTITFGSPVSAFGFWGVDFGDFGGDLQMVFSNGLSKTITVSTNGDPNGSVLFWGITETGASFQQIVFNNTMEGTDYFAFDDMTIGSQQQVKQTPEPATLMLLGFGLAGLATLRKKIKG